MLHVMSFCGATSLKLCSANSKNTAQFKEFVKDDA
jgi:hypothetical protein